jgi:cyclic pyranopterin phosphate synthase
MTGDGLLDPLGRQITYLRLSVTDRCDLRCQYCMPERAAFMPKTGVLTIEELERIANAFIDLGVRKVRLTGGEPLVRPGVMEIVASLGQRVRDGALEEVTLTTNGTQLGRHAKTLVANGVRRINVSLDTLDRARFTRIARRDALPMVLEGIKAALGAGLSVRINIVALRGENEDEIPDLIAWAHGLGLDVALIETMPLGDVGFDRTDQFLPLIQVRERLERRWRLDDIKHASGGPARYVRVGETGGRIGFITPLTDNFCATCNRVRVSADGKLHLCLGQEGAIDLKPALRGGDPDALGRAIRNAIVWKPARHSFEADRLGAPALTRHMSVTGG